MGYAASKSLLTKYKYVQLYEAVFSHICTRFASSIAWAKLWRLPGQQKLLSTESKVTGRKVYEIVSIQDRDD